MPRNINYNMSSVSLIYQWHCLIAYHCQLIIKIFSLPLYNKSVFWINAYSIMLLRSVHMRMREFIVNVSLQWDSWKEECFELSLEWVNWRSRAYGERNSIIDRRSCRTNGTLADSWTDNDTWLVKLMKFRLSRLLRNGTKLNERSEISWLLGV